MTPGGGHQRLLISCEHGGNRIPPAYRALFRRSQALLRSHRGYDPGALALARDFARGLHAPLVYSTTSRLLVDLNRSPGHPALHAPALRQLTPAERQAVLEAYYWPYRRQVEQGVARIVNAGARAVHVSSHSFTPKLDGELRRADIGLLYDPSRPGEAALCAAWRAALRAAAPGLVVRRNYPYRGTSDALVTDLRRRFSPSRYLGIEIEVNQKFAQAGGAQWRALRRLLVASLAQVLTAVRVARGPAASPDSRAPRRSGAPRAARAQLDRRTQA
jgi:predicted N-formylglutamate amidohydrolase